MNKVFLLSFISLFSFFTINAQEVYWPLSVQEINTGSNSTYFLQSANIDGASVTSGYILGAFFENDEGDLQCGGFVNCGSEDMGIAVMGDDTTTDEKDGFYEGEEITWLAYGSLLAQTYTASVLFSTSPPFGSNSYSTNGINIVSQFNISSDVLGCMSDTACNFNANATEEDSSCTYADENYNCDGTCIDTDGDTVCDIYEIEGCMDATACNYNELATNEDNSCTDPETNLNCDGNCLNDTDNDGICDENEIEGCTNNIACNYDATATDLDESCTFTSGCESCDSGTIIDNDLDDDGVCNDEEIVGCTDNTACNYNPLATDDNGNCTYTTGCQSCEEGAIIDNDVDNDGVCNDDEQEACLDTQACNYNSNPTFDSDSTLCIYVTAACDVCSGAEDGNGTIIDNDADNDGICNANEIEGCSDMTACNYDAIATDLDESCIYTAGCESCEEGIIIDNDLDDDGVCDVDEVVGCTDETGCNYNTLATDDVESCVYATGECDVCSGETNGTGSVIDNDGDDDGICNENEEGACVDTSACNYNSNPTFESDSTLCIYVTAACDVCSGAEDGTGTIIDNDADNDGICNANEIEGCSDMTACNYDAIATDLDESCIYTAGCESCEEGIIIDNDDDEDSVCNEDEVPGCTDTLACNYNTLATDDVESCVYATGECDVCSGETNGTGSLIDNDADNDGICNADEQEACLDTQACNYNSNPTFDSNSTLCIYATASCDVCSGAEDGTGTIIDNDADNDGLCDTQDIISGCTDEAACNYNSSSTVNSDNDLCTYTTVACESCSGVQDGTGTIIDNDLDDDGVCDLDEVVGCQSPEACNYLESATDASACVFANAICSVCEDGNSVIYDADNDGLCDAQDIISGCTDETACNYNSSSTVNSDNDICIYITVACETCSGAQDGTGTLLLNDTDLDGVCDDLEVFGCTDSLYIEYSALATELDESCVTLIIEGCTDSLAFNFSIMANTSIESCLFNIEVDFSTTSTNTTTIFGINPDNISLVLGDSLITEGDIIGGFYIIEGQLYCAGFTAWTVSDFDFSLWMDDPATIEIDGVTDDATIYWIVQQNETMLNYLVDFTTIQVSGDYTIVNQITLNENTIIGCMDTTAFNYNSEAFIGDGACVEVIFGCLDTEACNYNEEANTEDNSLCDSITALIPDFQNGQPLTVVTDANNPTYVWLLDEDVQSETSNEYTPYVNGIYTVVVTEDSGCTATASYILDNIGLDEYTVNQLNIHPNPAHNYIEINSTQSKIESLKLYSITGQLLQEYTVGAFQFKIERNSLPNGIYFIQAIVNGNEVTKRVLFK